MTENNITKVVMKSNEVFIYLRFYKSKLLLTINLKLHRTSLKFHIDHQLIVNQENLKSQTNSLSMHYESIKTVFCELSIYEITNRKKLLIKNLEICIILLY